MLQAQKILVRCSPSSKKRFISKANKEWVHLLAWILEQKQIQLKTFLDTSTQLNMLTQIRITFWQNDKFIKFLLILFYWLFQNQINNTNIFTHLSTQKSLRDLTSPTPRDPSCSSKLAPHQCRPCELRWQLAPRTGTESPKSPRIPLPFVTKLGLSPRILRQHLACLPCIGCLPSSRYMEKMREYLPVIQSSGLGGGLFE